ncbi:hypothetical protein [Candidatus Hecatella orcuttiae]|jgi:predicted  nucleic acid-binding Zn-ribbon protein|nr:hypothetical protein [Candidatus Hecatella orcuttiae]
MERCPRCGYAFNPRPNWMLTVCPKCGETLVRVKAGEDRLVKAFD